MRAARESLFVDQLNSVPSIHMRCRMTASLRARRRPWPCGGLFAWWTWLLKPSVPTIWARESAERRAPNR